MNEFKTFLRQQFRLGEHSYHGPSHWERVERYGLYLVRQQGGDEELVSLFAWLHDSCRKREVFDPRHGPRAAVLARQLNGRFYYLEEARLELLVEACRDHTRGKTHADPTIGACWDADRLDLDRVGMTPDPRYLSTEPAKDLCALDPRARQARVS